MSDTIVQPSLGWDLCFRYRGGGSQGANLAGRQF